VAPERSEWRKLVIVLVAALGLLVTVILVFGSGGSRQEGDDTAPMSSLDRKAGDLPVGDYPVAVPDAGAADAAADHGLPSADTADASPPDASATADAGPAGPGPDLGPPAQDPAAARRRAERAYKQGVRSFVEGKTAAARSSFRAATKADPSYAPAYRGLGLAYEREGDARRAIWALRKYLALEPNAQDAESIRARVARLGG
jgi:tetratricopeptide (TPR) repeat protein